MSYNSPSTGEPCKAPHLIAEIMISREAKKKNIPLPHKFWNTDEWKKKYKLQIMAAHTLLKVYSAQAILNTLKRKDCQWQYSLRANGIPEAIDEEQKKLDKEVKLIEESKKVEVQNPTEFRQVSSGQVSKKARLD